jgi:predicted alpha/beta superfamily hydrolase
MPAVRHLNLFVFLYLLGAMLGHPGPALSGEAEPVGTPLVAGSSFSLSSQVFGDTRTVNVFVPFGYEDSDTRYPVLYVVDGGFHQDYLPLTGMAALATLSGQYRPFILVGVQTENRQYELTPASTDSLDLHYLPVNGGAGEFRRFLVTEVKPFIEGKYRTSGEDAIIGESLAGLFITETFLRAPDSFQHYIAVSPSLWWRSMGLSLEAAELLQAADFPENRSFYLTAADEGGMMLEAVERLASALGDHAPAGLKWWYEPMPEEHHNTIYNPATLKALRLVFAGE